MSSAPDSDRSTLLLARIAAKEQRLKELRSAKPREDDDALRSLLARQELLLSTITTEHKQEMAQVATSHRIVLRSRRAAHSASSQRLQLLAVEDDHRVQLSKLEAKAHEAALERDRARRESDSMRIQMEQEASSALEALKTMRSLEQVSPGRTAQGGRAQGGEHRAVAWGGESGDSFPQPALVVPSPSDAPPANDFPAV